VLGEIVAIDKQARQVTLKATTGQNVAVQLDDKTSYRRVPAGETTLDKAVVITFDDIGVGDRVIARGNKDERSGTLLAAALIVVSKSDIAKKRELGRAEWLKRGITGVITSLSAATGEFTLLTRLPEGAKSTLVKPSENVRLRRYSPDSIKFSEAKPSSFAELKVGDFVRALGDKSPDAKTFIAEEIVSGTFRTASGTVTAVDASSGEIKIADAQSQQPLTIVVNKDSMLRRLSSAENDLLKKMLAGNASSGGNSSAEFQERIEKLPSISLSELKPGDALLISSTSGSTPSRVTAIIIAAGVESFLKWQGQQANAKPFTFGLGLPSGSPID
jgi:hypothetical protein